MGPTSGYGFDIALRDRNKRRAAHAKPWKPPVIFQPTDQTSRACGRRLGH